MAGDGLSNKDTSQSTQLRKIFLHARNINLLWRYEILDSNNIDATELIGEMEDDIFWDLSEINIEKEITKSLRMTNMGLKVLPDTMSIPVSTQILDFSGNSLSDLPKGWYEHFENLQIFRIANNNFTSLPWDALSHMSSLRIIDLRNNPWDEEFLIKFKSYIHMFSSKLQKLYI